jgi:diadenosine tetraphosphatase ApaH/serine/threonine PP2A family protein phosphatase
LSKFKAILNSNKLMEPTRLSKRSKGAGASFSPSFFPAIPLQHSLSETRVPISHAVDRIFCGFESVLSDSETDVLEIGRSIAIPSFLAEDIIDLCESARELFSRQTIVLRVDCAVCVVGDIHGSLHDLVRIIRTHGITRNYLFLGDYVDRGQFSLECILLLFALFVKYPGQFNLLRGNHELRQVAGTYGFRTEIMEHYSVAVFDAFCSAFAWMPLAAIVQTHFFCVHGGLGRSIRTIDQLDAIPRPIVDETDHVSVKPLLWADPSDTCSRYAASPRAGEEGLYGYLAVRDFLQENSLDCIIRAHECVDAIRRLESMPVVTVFSASNYDAGIPNRSGVIEIDARSQTKHFKYPPLERMKRADALFFTFAPRKASDHAMRHSPSSIPQTMPPKKPSALAYVRTPGGLIRRGSANSYGLGLLISGIREEQEEREVTDPSPLT